MRLVIKSSISGQYTEVYKRFDKKLFEHLKPKRGKMDVLRFDGSKTGDEIHLAFGGLVPFKWISVITSDEVNDKEAFFVDEGVVLPPGLKYWKHRHIIRRVSDTESEIIDDMEFRGLFFLVTWVMYPFFYLVFSPRRKAYQAYFGKPS